MQEQTELVDSAGSSGTLSPATTTTTDSTSSVADSPRRPIDANGINIKGSITRLRYLEKFRSINGTDSGRVGLGGLIGDVDKGMMMRMAAVVLTITFLILLYFGIRMWRMKSREKRTRRYDILSAKQLQPDLIIDSDSEDDLFDDGHANLVSQK